MTKKEIKELLVRNGISGLMTVNFLADKLMFNRAIIYHAIHEGLLAKRDWNCIHVDDVVDWISMRPRYVTKLNEKEAQNG